MSSINKQKRFIKSSISTALIASSIAGVVTPGVASAFNDLNPSNSHYGNILNLLERGVIKGYPDGTFRPNVAVTRGQAAKIIAKALNLDTNHKGSLQFSDVKKTDEYYPYIAALVEAGIVSGFNDHTFKPQETITRGQMAKMIALGFNLTKATNNFSFTDVPSNNQYSGFVSALFDANVTTGKTDKTFDLSGFVTRGQLASFVVRAENAVQNNETTVLGTIEQIADKKIMINGKQYNIDKKVDFLFNSENYEALYNADVAFTTKNNVIISVSSLNLKNGSYFDGNNAEISSLKLASSIKALKNVKADTVHYIVNGQTKIESVTAKKIVAQGDKSPVASLEDVTLPTIDLIINGSNIEIVQLEGTVVSVKKTASIISKFEAENVSTLQMYGDFEQVLVTTSTKLLGSAIINSLQFSETNIQGFSPSSSVKINNVVLNGETLSWQEAERLINPDENNNVGKNEDTNIVTTPPSITPPTPTIPENPSDSGINNEDGHKNNQDEIISPPVKGDDNLSTDSGNDNKDYTPPEENPPASPEIEQEGDTPPGHSEDENLNNPENEIEIPPVKEEDQSTDLPKEGPAALVTENLSLSTLLNSITGITSTADVGAVITTYDESGNFIGESTINADGTFNIPFNRAAPAGQKLKIIVTKNNLTTQLLWSVPNNNQENGNETITPPPSDNIVLDTIEIADNKIILPSSSGEEPVSYTVTDNIAAFFLNNISALSNVKMEVSNGEVKTISEATITSDSTFDGASLAGIVIDTVTLNGASTIENINNVNNLIVTTDENHLSFYGVSANITAKGNFDSLSGAEGENLIISSTNPNVIVSNTTSKNIIIDEKIAVGKQIAGKRMASLTSEFIAANNTNMQITFKDGNYTNQTLTISRQDVVVNIEGTPFSKVSITSNNVNLITNGKEINRLTLSDNVTYVALDANVSLFEANLDKPLTIHSSSPKTIDELKINAIQSDIEGWIDLINVTVTKASLNEGTIETSGANKHMIFKKYAAAPIPVFSSALERVSFGLYKINAAAATHYVFVTDPAQLDTYKNAVTLPVEAVPYTTDSSIVLYANAVEVVVYNTDASGNLTGVSVANPPDDLLLVRLNKKTDKGELTFFTRFSDQQSPSDMLKTIHIFKNGILSKSTNVTGSWTKLSTGLNAITVNTGVTLDSKREVIIGNNTLASYGADVKTYESDYVRIIKKVAEISAQTKDTNIMNETLKYVFSKTEGTYNSFFLTKYVDAINADPTSLNNLSDFNELISEVNNENQYDSNPTISPADLYFNGKIQSIFSYSADGIVTNTVNDKGELLFKAIAAGTTTVRVIDSTGLATLIAVTVNANKDISYEVLATDAPTGTLLEGTANFRYSESKIIATTFTKENNVLKNAAAIIQQNGSTTALTRVMLLATGTSYQLSTAATITPVTMLSTEFGLDEVKAVVGENVGFQNIGNGNILFYPRYEGSELIFVSDGTKEVAVNMVTTTTVDDLANSIARSNELTIGSNLNLLSVNDHLFTGIASKNVFLYENGSTIRVFAKDAFTGSVKLVDSANTAILVNVTVTKTAQNVTVKDLEVVKTSLATDNSGATVQHIDQPIVRSNGLDLYAIGTGTTTVTLSNGKQYAVTVNAVNGMYTIKADLVQNLYITAAELHMSDIKEVLGASAVQYVKNNSEAIITLANTSEAVVTLISSSNEKTLIKVTKNGSDYSYEAYRTIVSPAELGLTAMSNVYNVGTTPSVPYARAKVQEDLLYVYNVGIGNQSFRVTDGINSTAINVTVTADGLGYKSTPTAVTHKIPAEFELANQTTISSSAAHLVGDTLYATGLGLSNNNTAKIEVPLKTDTAIPFNYVIGLAYDVDTGLFSFDQNPSVTFSLNYTKEQLGLDTIISATTAASSIVASASNSGVNIAVSGDAADRIEITGTYNNQTVKTFIYVSRIDNDITQVIERAEITENDKQVALNLNLKKYGYTTTPTGIWTVANVSRATISSDLKANFYGLNSGDTALQLTDSNGKNLLINITADENNPRSLTAMVVEAALSADLSLTGTIIEGDGVRLSDDRTTVYATRVGTPTKVKLSNNTYIVYTVTENADGQFVLTPAPIANVTTITAAQLGLSGKITAANLDLTIVSKTEYNDSIVLTGLKDGNTAMLVSDSTGKSVLVNVKVAGDTVTATRLEPKAATSAPTLLPNEPASVVRIDGTNVYGIGEGTVRLLVDNTIQEVQVTKTNGHYVMTDLTHISDAVLTATDLGFSANAALDIETAAHANFYVGQIDGKMVAYSKLAGAATGSFEFIVKATDTGARTLVRLNDKGIDLIEHKVAKKAAIAFDNATTVVFNDVSLARFDATNDVLYLLAEGSTYVTANNHLHAVDITRDSEGYLYAEVRQLSITGEGKTFTAISGTDNSIIDLTANEIFAKAIGTTKVKLGSDILTITIGKDATGKYTMTPTVTTSKFVAVGDAGLTSFESAEVIAGTANAVSLSIDDTGLTIYSNGATTAQSLLVRVVDEDDNRAIINVTIDGTGAVSKADVVSETVTTTGTSAKQSVQTANARGVWDGTILTVYALSAGNSTLKFDSGLVNISSTADGHKVNKPTITPVDHGFTNMDIVTNGALINNHYFIAEGTGLIYVNDKVYSLSVSKVNEQYVKTISSGSPATTLDLTAIGGTFAQDKSLLNTVNVVNDTVKEVADPEKLVIYATGTGVSEIAITLADGMVVYQTNATATSITEPIIPQAQLGSGFEEATIKLGDSLRLVAGSHNEPSKLDTMYFLKEGVTTLIKDDKLINVDVIRDTDGFFTASPAFVTATVKEKVNDTLNHFIVANETTLYAKANTAEETFYTANYRVTAKTTAENGLYALTVDERHMNTFDVADYFPTGPVTVKATGGNTNANAVRAEVVDDKLVIYAGATAGNALITFTNGTKEVAFNVIHGLDGTIVATPQAAVDSLKFVNIGLSTATHAISISDEFDTNVAEVTATNTGLTINALKAGTTSVALRQNGAIVGFVNIKVESVNNNLQITSTPVAYNVSETRLMTTMDTPPRLHDGKQYVTSTGRILYGAGNQATSVVVVKNAASGLYSATKSLHTLATISADKMDLNEMTHISINGTSVEAVASDDKSTLYIYGINNGTSDVVVSNGSQYATIVVKNGTTLVPTIASKKLDVKDQLTGASWETNLVEVRDNTIYATHVGKAVATATIGSYKALMNIEVTRKADQTFAIHYDVVDHNDFTSNVTILSGTSIKADGSRIFAQHVGQSTIQVASNVYTVDVTQSADGLYHIVVSDPVEAKTITAESLGLTTLTKYTAAAITGAGVVAAEIVNDSIVLQAKYAGEAQITVEDGSNTTIIHVLVINENGKLTLTPTIAKAVLAVAPSTSEAETIKAGNIFRTVGDTLFAVKEGSVVAAINGELHKLNAKKANNVLIPSAEKITATLPGIVSAPTNSAVLTAHGNQVTALGFGTERITVDGNRTFRITVNNDGSVISEELVANTVNLENILNSVVSEQITTSAIAKVTYLGTTATIDPLSAGTDTLTISDGVNAIQVKVTVTDNNGVKTVTTEIPSKKLYTGTIGFYPTNITMSDGTAFASKQGVVKLTNGEITIYPGEVGTAQLIVHDDLGKTALYELTVNDDYSYSFAPFKQTVGYDAFKFKPVILKKVGNAYAAIGETGLDISFEDTEKTIFVVKGDTGYKVLITQAEIDTAVNTFSAKTPLVYDALTVNGKITNVKGIQVAEDSNTSILYVDHNTTYPASYTFNETIYEVLENTNPAIKTQIVSNPLVATTTYTSTEFVEGTEVVAFNTNQWVAKTNGTGIYKVNDNKYVSVTVSEKADTNSYEIFELPTPLESIALPVPADSTIKVIAPTQNVYIDGTTVFGTSTEKIVVSVEQNSEKILYSGTFASGTFTPIKKIIANELGWTEFASHNLNASSSILRIQGNEIFALSVGKEMITFTSPNGLQRTVQVEVTADYEIVFGPIDPNIITYVAHEPGDGVNEISFTFTVNIPTNIQVVESNTVGDVDIYNHNEISIFTKPGIVTSNTFTMTFPEISSNPVELVITIQNIGDVTVTSTNPVFRFDKVTQVKDFTATP